MSALIYLNQRIGRERYLLQILYPHIRHNTQYSIPSTHYPGRGIFKDLFIKGPTKSSNICFILTPGRRVLKTSGMGMGLGIGINTCYIHHSI